MLFDDISLEMPTSLHNAISRARVCESNDLTNTERGKIRKKKNKAPPPSGTKTVRKKSYDNVTRISDGRTEAKRRKKTHAHTLTLAHLLGIEKRARPRAVTNYDNACDKKKNTHKTRFLISAPTTALSLAAAWNNPTTSPSGDRRQAEKRNNNARLRRTTTTTVLLFS